MKYLKEKDTEKFEKGKSTVTFEYPLGEEDINIGFATIKGRMPESGYCYNEKCKELIYITKGIGTFYLLSGEEVAFKEKDVILIDIGDAYYFEGDFEMTMSCTPAWYPEQHIQIEK